MASMNTSISLNLRYPGRRGDIQRGLREWKALGGDRPDYGLEYEAFIAERLSGRSERARLKAQAIAQARAFAAMVDALPVGRDIRNRLAGHLQAHVELLEHLHGVEQDTYAPSGK